MSDLRWSARKRTALIQKKTEKKIGTHRHVVLCIPGVLIAVWFDGGSSHSGG